MALPFSEFVEKNGFIFVSGQVPLNAQGEMIEGTIDEKAHQVMKNLQKVLKSAESSLADVVKTTIFLTDMADFDKVNAVYASYFEGSYPARETICIKALPLNSQIEISMIAARN